MNVEYYSSLALVTSVVVYVLAMVCHTCEWAAARRIAPEDTAAAGERTVAESAPAFAAVHASGAVTSRAAETTAAAAPGISHRSDSASGARSAAEPGGGRTAYFTRRVHIM